MILVAAAWLGMAAMMASPTAAAPSNDLATYKPTDPVALAYFDEGNRLYEAASDKRRPRADRNADLERAVVAYTAGREKQAAPAFDYNLGLTYKALGRNADAIDHLQRFLARIPVDVAFRVSVEKKIDSLDPSGELRADLERKHAAASTPLVAMAPAPNDALRTSPPPSAAPAEPAASSSSTDTATRTPAHWGRIAGWGLTGAALGGAVVTTWLVVDAQSLDRQASDAKANPLESVRNQLTARASSRRSAATIVGIGSGALLVSGVLVLVLTSGSDPPPRVGWNVGITTTGVAVMGRF